MTRIACIVFMVMVLATGAVAQTAPPEAPAVAAPSGPGPGPATTPFLQDQPSGLHPILYAVPAGLLLIGAALGLVTLRAARRIREQGR